MDYLELYIGPKGTVYIGGKKIFLSGEPLHASMVNLKTKREPVWRMLSKEWFRLMELWADVYPVVNRTIYNVTAMKEKTRKEGYVSVNLFVDMEAEPKARLRWGPERPPTSKQIMDDLMALLQLVQYDLRFPAVLEQHGDSFALGAIVNSRAEAEKVVDYLDGILERNFPYVLKSLVVV